MAQKSSKRSKAKTSTRSGQKKRGSVKTSHPSGQSTQSKSRRRPVSAQRHPLKFLFKWGVVGVIWGGIGGFIISAYYLVTMPDFSNVAAIQTQARVEVYDRFDQRMTHFGGARGQTISVQDLPDHVKQAVIAIEDRRFYTHFGLDLRGIARAMVVNIRRGQFVQGGSTLTQQLAKNLFLTPDKTLNRKIREVYLALWLEYKLTKDEILTAYLNRVYFGSGAYGLSAAAERYFNKPAHHLNLAQSVQLAASLKAPSRLNPLADRQALVKRSKHVLTAMMDQGYIDAQDRKHALSSIQHSPVRQNSYIHDTQTPHYFVDWIRHQIGGYVTGSAGKIYIHTGFDPDLQDILNTHTNRFFKTSAGPSDIDQVAMVLMEYDGQVRAMVGGRDYTKSQFNRAIQAKRAPGSVFKPFVYMTALQKGYTKKTYVLDQKFTRTDTYTPKNFKNEYQGQVRLSHALRESLNTATVRLAQDVGMRDIIKTAHRFGLTTSIEHDLSTALGSSAARLIDLTSAYAGFANGGYAVYPYSVLRIFDQEHNDLFSYDQGVKLQSLAKPRHIKDMKDMLRSVMDEGTGKQAFFLGLSDYGGKTGTSQDYRDAWFIGYADGYVLGVWMGNDDNRPMSSVTGGRYPALLWGNIMRDVLEIRPLTSSY